jgi:hypothetical protein
MTVYRINVTHREIGEPVEYVTEDFGSYKEAKERIRYINTNERWVRADNWVEEVELEYGA